MAKAGPILGPSPRGSQGMGLVGVPHLCNSEDNENIGLLVQNITNFQTAMQRTKYMGPFRAQGPGDDGTTCPPMKAALPALGKSKINASPVT